MPAIKDSLASYTVQYLLPTTLETDHHTVMAAYFTEEGALTVFKDCDHKAVFAVRADIVLSIKRGSRV